jgi:hypothetical protein
MSRRRVAPSSLPLMKDNLRPESAEKIIYMVKQNSKNTYLFLNGND